MVLTRGAVTLWHGATHRQIPVPLTTTQIVFVVATTALPLLGAGLLWTARKLAAIWLITVSLLAALLFGFINHFVVHSTSDYLLAVPAHPWGTGSSSRPLCSWSPTRLASPSGSWQCSRGDAAPESHTAT